MKRIILDESQGTLPGLRRAVQEICEVLPTLEITGSRDIAVDRTQMGTVIRTTKGSNMIPQQTKAEDPFKNVTNYCYQTTVNGVPSIKVNYGHVNFGTETFTYADLWLSIPTYSTEHTNTYYICRTVTYNPTSKTYTWDTKFIREDYMNSASNRYQWVFQLATLWVQDINIISLWSSWTAGLISIYDRLGA